MLTEQPDASRAPEQSRAAQRLSQAAQWAALGRIDEATAAYGQILAEDGSSKEALVALSVLALRRGDAIDARDLLERASVAHPADAPLLVAYGRMLRKTGDPRRALEVFRTAAHLAPGLIDAWISFAATSRVLGDLDAAHDAFRKALEIEPGNVAVLIHCAQVLVEQGRTAPAEVLFRRAVKRDPAAAEAHLGLGRVLAGSQRRTEALDSLRRAVSLNPEAIEARFHLGRTLLAAGARDEAQAQLEAVVAKAPDHAQAWLLLAGIARDSRRPEDAARCYRRCLALQPSEVTALAQLSIIERLHGRMGEADELVNRALAVDPDHVVALFSQADGLASLGLGEDAQRVFERLLRHESVEEFMAQNALFSGNYVSSQPAAARARHEAFVTKYYEGRPFVHGKRSPMKRPLRVGYVSSDFKLHSVAYFMEAVFRHADRERCELHVYHNNDVHDEVSERFKRRATAWTPCFAMPDEVLAERIRSDGIDILVDLNGHTGGSRLRVFAWKPAPVQATWLGYPTTTGLRTMDYRISDRHVDPESEEGTNVERVVRLPNSYFCYCPPDPSPEVAPLPASRKAFVTFGSFNNLAKVSDQTLALWGRVLEAVPDARFLFKARATHDRWARQRIRDRFAAAGVDVGRVELHGWSIEDRRHLELYGQIDIALDTYPYNGATTTCEALWMGVPVITLAGASHASRMGLSLLSAAGEEALIAHNEQEFVHKAATLAAQPARLAHWRGTARPRLAASALFDAPRFAADLEAAYVHMWSSAGG